MILKKNAGQPFKKILVINPFGIGDVLFTTPLIKAVKERYPDTFIGYWCNKRVEPLICANKSINKVFALSRGDLKKIYADSFFTGLFNAVKLVWRIKREHFDLTLDFSLDHRYSLFAKVIGIRRRIGFDYKGRGRFLTDKIVIDGYSDKHAVEYYSDLLKFLGIEVKEKKLGLDLPDYAQGKAGNLLALKGIEATDVIVGIAPGAGGSWGKDASYKHWPALKFAQLADRIIEELKAKIVILGDASEKPIAEVMFNAMRNKPIDLTGKTSLDILPALIKNLQLLICNDGGPMHIAVALGVKTVALFGPVSDIVYGPYPDRRNHLVIKRTMECQPCYKNFRLPECDRDKECIKSISVDEVFEGVKRII